MTKYKMEICSYQHSSGYNYITITNQDTGKVYKWDALRIYGLVKFDAREHGILYRIKHLLKPLIPVPDMCFFDVKRVRNVGDVIEIVGNDE